MKFDFQLPLSVMGLMVCCLIFPFLPSLHIPLFNGLTVKVIESMQALMLLGFAIFSYFYIRRFELSPSQKQFWLWSVAWWVMLLGRSISWGRDYFPDVPKFYFRTISICMISPVVLMLFSSTLRHEIAHKFKHAKISAGAFLLVIVGLLISDGIEHNRYLISSILSDLQYKDLLEELYEFPLIIGLFLVAYPLMKTDGVKALPTQKEMKEDDIHHSGTNISI